jgi:hypothetical protein
MYAAMFEHASARLTIGSLDNSLLQVEAQYNPHEIQIEKAIPWAQHSVRDNRSWFRRDDQKQADLEFTGAPGRAMSLELLFDGFEKNNSVESDAELLEELASVKDPESTEDEPRRPHYCVVTFGADGMRPFRCVIESVTTKFTMFSDKGAPLRALCSVKLREANVMSVKIKDPGK